MAGRPLAPLENPPNRIREWRMRLGFTQQRLGAALGVTHETIRKWETGENSVSVAQLESVARVMGMRALDLLNT